MGRSKRLLSIILLIGVLCGCSKVPTQSKIDEIKSSEKETTINTQDAEDLAIGELTRQDDNEEYETGPEDILASQGYEIGNGMHFVDRSGEEKIRFWVTSGEVQFSAGMMMFINGIPQSFTDESGNSMYLSYVQLGSNDSKTEYYTCDYNNVPEAESYTCRMMCMLMPDTIIVKRKNFYIGFLQDLTNGGPRAIECSEYTDVDIVQLKADSIVESDREYGLQVSYGINNSINPRTVIRRDEADSYTIVIDSPDTSGDFVISFWGNGQPVQVGDHMFYKVSVDNGMEYTYTFELDEELVNSVDNFFAVVCPSTEDDWYSKTSTTIFVDEYE